jgi:hypothetical protein
MMLLWFIGVGLALVRMVSQEECAAFE